MAEERRGDVEEKGREGGMDGEMELEGDSSRSFVCLLLAILHLLVFSFSLASHTFECIVSLFYQVSKSSLL